MTLNQIALLFKYVEDNKQGAFSFEGGVTRVMEDLTGSPAESFATTAQRYAARSFARQTLANRLKAAANFAIVPLYPGYNLKAYERAPELPTPARALYCMEDEGWKQSRAAQMAEQKAYHHGSSSIRDHGPLVTSLNTAPEV